MEILKVFGVIVAFVLLFGHLFLDAYERLKAKLEYEKWCRDANKQIRPRMTLAEFREEQIKHPTRAANRFAELCSEVLPDIQVLREEIRGPFILDFYFPTAQLCVEIDGGVHDEPKQRHYDEQRTAYLKKTHGIRVIRFTNDEVLRQPDIVMCQLEWNVKLGDFPRSN